MRTGGDLQSPTLFLFADDRQEFPLITLAEKTNIDDTEEPEEESIDELDFSMF